MAFDQKMVQAIQKQRHEADMKALADKVRTLVESADGRFLRFLDAAAKAGLVVQPRWKLDKDVTTAPIHTFHLESLRFATGKKKPVALDGLDWTWLFGHLDYPHEAKERLLDMARADAVAWVQAQKASPPSAGQTRVSDALEFLFGQPFPTVRPAWLTMPGYVHPSELDGYCESLGLAFEFQGNQHYEAVQRYQMTDEALLQRQYNDAWKRLAVFKSKVYLVEVLDNELPDDKSVQAMAAVLLHKLNSNGTGRKFLANVNTPQGVALLATMGFKA